MRVLIASKALVSAVYRKKLTAMSELGLEIVAVVPPSWREGGGEQRFEAAEATGFDLVVSPLRWNGHFHLHYYPELPHIVADVRPELLYMDEEPYNLATLLGIRAAARHRIPSLFFTWQNICRRYPLPVRLLERNVYSKARRALAGNEEAAAVLRTKGYCGTITVVPQFGVDPVLFSPDSPAPGPFTVGFFNRLIPAKAPLQTLAAFSGLPDDSRLRIIGDGSLRTEVEDAVVARGLGDRVTLSPRIPSGSMPDEIRRVHAVVLPSLTTTRWKEQFGRILVEAMACGVPVVGSDSGEIPRVVGDAGLIVPEGDVDGLRCALLRLYRDSDLRRRLGEAGRNRVLERFTNERVARITAEACIAASSEREM